MPRSLRRAALMLVPWAVFAAAAPAQRAAAPAVGSITFHLRMPTPDTAKATIPLGDTLDLTMTMMSNGHLVSFELSPGPGLGMPILQGLVVRVLLQPSLDTVHAAVLFPHELIAPGGPAGYRLDAPLPRVDSLLNGMSVAAAVRDTTAHFRSLAMKSTVAGQVCEEWIYIAPTDTLHECLIAESPEIHALRDQFSGAPWLAPILAAARASTATSAFGGRTMLPLRLDTSTGVHLEVTGISARIPDSTHFALPENLTPFVNPFHPGGE